MAAVVFQALYDIKDWKLSDPKRDEAMEYLLGPDCEALCLTVDIDYRMIKEQAAERYRDFLAKAG
jgi:hypothetical protein